VVLAGVKAGEAEGVIRNAVARLYKGVTVSVNFGQLRAITVYVVGQASRPGTYTVSSLSTLVTALFASGGPNANGSMRRVQVKRGGKVAAELDLYAFIARATSRPTSSCRTATPSISRRRAAMWRWSARSTARPSTN
jgi:protein involved in polysaccharide export with SLBB domain